MGLVCSVYTLSHQLPTTSHQMLTVHTCGHDAVKTFLSVDVHSPGTCSTAKYNLQVSYPEHTLKQLYCISMGHNMLIQSMLCIFLAILQQCITQWQLK